MAYRVAVVFGGKSVEHEVSVISALQMMENMDLSQYQPFPVYLSKDNQFYYNEAMHDIEYFKDLSKVQNDANRVVLFKTQNGMQIRSAFKNKLKTLADIDVAFLVVHGTGCEDGTLSAYFDLLDIPYVASGILPSALYQNKWKMKQLLDYNKIPVIPYYGFYETDYDRQEAEVVKSCEALGYPLIVKPATLGSSVGITKCINEEGLKEAILTALQYDTEVLVEKAAVNLWELNCSVKGNLEQLEISRVERVMQTDEILSYEDKYVRGNKCKGMAGTYRIIPADIPDELQKEVESLSVKATKIAGLCGVMRIDFIYDRDEQKLYLNEINTIPGSLAFYLWDAKGIKYRELISQLIELCIGQYRIKKSKVYSYETNILSMPKNFSKGKL